MGNRLKITLMDYVKVNRKAGREEELLAHGRPVRIDRVHRSKKMYDRKKSKAELNKGLPYFLRCWGGVSGFCNCSILEIK